MALFLLTRTLTVEALREVFGAFSPRYLFSIGLWLVAVGRGVNFLLEIRRMVGQDNLWRLLTGHYGRPRDEERMDLVGSTGTAERLGHERYSQFIQACFRDLTGVALESGGTIYQNVGDEVVMTWLAKGEGARMRSVQAFFGYEKSLSEREPWYLDRFGVVPVFRGGIDVGSVMATEVGELKRAIAYHRDVLNTASRLLDLCKERGGRLLVSERVGGQVMDDATVLVEWQGEVWMEGKEEATRVFSLEPGGGGPVSDPVLFQNPAYVNRLA
ncbi:MAG: adenylate/guanylate cyclase domain-containing protein [Gemmatimonadota bacterium]